MWWGSEVVKGPSVTEHGGEGAADPVASNSQSGFSSSSMGVRLVPQLPVRMSDYMMVLQLGTIVVSRGMLQPVLDHCGLRGHLGSPWLFYGKRALKILIPRKTSSRSFRKDEGVKKEGRMLGAVAWDLRLVSRSPTGVEAPWGRLASISFSLYSHRLGHVCHIVGTQRSWGNE